jgi:hypothetical protein
MGAVSTAGGPLTTRKQREMMEHAIGVPARRGSKPGWRNCYNTTADDADWTALVASGLAILGHAVPGGSAYFHVTDAGYAELGIKPPKREAVRG